MYLSISSWLRSPSSTFTTTSCLGDCQGGLDWLAQSSEMSARAILGMFGVSLTFLRGQQSSQVLERSLAFEFRQLAITFLMIISCFGLFYPYFSTKRLVRSLSLAIFFDLTYLTFITSILLLAKIIFTMRRLLFLAVVIVIAESNLSSTQNYSKGKDFPVDLSILNDFKQAAIDLTDMYSRKTNPQTITDLIQAQQKQYFEVSQQADILQSEQAIVYATEDDLQLQLERAPMTVEVDFSYFETLKDTVDLISELQTSPVCQKDKLKSILSKLRRNQEIDCSRFQETLSQLKESASKQALDYVGAQVREKEEYERTYKRSKEELQSLLDANKEQRGRIDAALKYAMSKASRELDLLEGMQQLQKDLISYGERDEVESGMWIRLSEEIKFMFESELKRISE